MGGIARWPSDRLAELRRHPYVAAGLALTAIGTVWIRAEEGVAGKSIAYLAAMLASAVLVDLISARDGPPPGFPVRRPLRETIVLLTLTAVGAAWFVWSRCLPDSWQRLPAAARGVVSLVGLAGLFQIAGALYLFASRYRPAELGLRLRGLYVAPAVIALVEVTAFAVDPDHITLPYILREMGWTGLLAFALLGEPLVEEFLRMALQTRLGALLSNRAAGWFLAALPWAALHVPVWYSKSGSAAGAFEGALCIVPIGLLWSYVTLRTGSFVPAVLVHGFNVWGLQNP